MNDLSGKIIAGSMMLLLLSGDVSFAQGLPRSSGIGARSRYWKTTNGLQGNSVLSGGEVASGGYGGLLYFYTQVNDRWALETSIGGSEVSSYVGPRGVFSTELIPILFAGRYSLLSAKLPSALQPYWTVGSGLYWVISDAIDHGGVREEFDTKLGVYTGAGINLALSSRFALNFASNYHFVDFRAKGDFSGLEFGLGLTYMFGRKREIFQVEEIKIVIKDLYPAHYQFYNAYPLALVTVKNVAGYPIEVNVRCYIEGISVRPRDSGFLRLERGETKDIPATAILGASLQQVAQREMAVLDFEIEARAGKTQMKQLSAEIRVHNRNAWNGEIDMLSFFVTPDDEAVLRTSRQIMNASQPEDALIPENLHKANVIFEALHEMNIRYQSDPNIPFYQDDRVQFASETLTLRSGDCDDLVILCSSMLESLGIKTALVDVQDPQKEIAHLYLMFDSGLSPSHGDMVSSNPKRYVVREKPVGTQSIWIPIETTLIAHGFEEAWKAGALEYLQDGVLGGGIDAGWVRIIDLN